MVFLAAGKLMQLQEEIKEPMAVDNTCAPATRLSARPFKVRAAVFPNKPTLHVRKSHLFCGRANSFSLLAREGKR